MAASTPRLKVTVLSPLAPRKAHATTGAPPLRAFAPDGGIDGLLGQIPVGVKIEVGDPFGGSASKLRVDLTFKGPKSFRPDGIVAQVPALRALAEVPGRLRELSARKASRSDIVRDLAQILPSAAWAEVLAPTTGGGSSGGAAAPAPAPVASSGSSSIDDILSHTETSEAPRTSAFSSLISQIAKGGSSVPRSSSLASTDLATRAFGSILGEILDHPEIRRLERAWRGARYFLGEATSPIDVEIVPIDDTNLPEALAYLVERPADVIAPPDLLVLDLDIPLNAAGLGALEIPAIIAEQLRAPLVVGARFDDDFDNEETTKALRDAGKSEWAPWVVLAANGGLVRGPLSLPASGAPASEKLKVTWAQDTSAPGARVFASAPWLVATLCARAFKDGGWPAPITGPEAGVLSGFDVHGVVAGGATSMFATERLMTNEGAQRQARRGILALTSIPNRDNIACIAAPTLAAAGGDGAPTLADQLFIARVAGVVATIGAALPPGTDPASAEQVVAATLADLFPRHGNRVPFLETKVTGDRVSVVVTPRRFAGTTMGEFTLDVPSGDDEG